MEGVELSKEKFTALLAMQRCHNHGPRAGAVRHWHAICVSVQLAGVACVPLKVTVLEPCVKAKGCSCDGQGCNEWS